MLLDLRTIYVVTATACLVLGMVQMMAYAAGRFERWPPWWGLSNLIVGMGIFGLSLQRADEAVYCSKRAGRDRVEVCLSKRQAA